VANRRVEGAVRWGEKQRSFYSDPGDSQLTSPFHSTDVRDVAAVRAMPESRLVKDAHSKFETRLSWNRTVTTMR
jgi:hypothetical protein